MSSKHVMSKTRILLPTSPQSLLSFSGPGGPCFQLSIIELQWLLPTAFFSHLSLLPSAHCHYLPKAFGAHPCPRFVSF